MSLSPRICGTLLALVLLLGGCTTVQVVEDLETYRSELVRLERILQRQPNNFVALRRTGVIYSRTDHASVAVTYLERAHAVDADDPQTLFYLGVAYEVVGRNVEALETYRRYTDVPRLSKYRTLMAGRERWVMREVARDELRALITNETAISQAALAPERLAVFPLTARVENPAYAALGRGMAEMMSTDLSNVQRLQLVERVRLQVLLDELKLAETGMMDTTSMPRAGRLLGAGRIVGGSYLIDADNGVQLDATLLDVATAELPELNSAEGTLERIFRMEKELVFALLNSMSITISAAERVRIEHIPTENMQAFLAFSRGLQEEDRGQYELAQLSYQQAFTLDPTFTEAQAYADDLAVFATDLAGIPSSQVIRFIGSRVPEDGAIPDLIDERTESLIIALDVVNPEPGNVSRQPEGPPETGLADPPPPPGGF